MGYNSKHNAKLLVHACRYQCIWLEMYVHVLACMGFKWYHTNVKINADCV